MNKKSIYKLVGLIAILVALGIVYYGLFVFSDGDAVVDVGGNGDYSRSNSLYIDASSFSSPREEHGVSFRSLMNRAVVLWNLRNKLQENDYLVVKAKMKGEGILKMNIDCFNCVDKTIYNNDVVLDNTFYDSDIFSSDKYRQVGAFEDASVFVSESIAEDAREAKSFAEWIKLNRSLVDDGSLSFFGLFNINSIINSQEVETDFDRLPFGVRGDFSALVYLTRQKFHLTLSKRDFNWYEGEDRVTVSLKDMNGNVLSQEILHDDGVINVGGESVDVQEVAIEADISRPGLYLVEVKEVRNDEGLGYSDFYINNVVTNVNKLVLFGQIVLPKATNIYFSSDSEGGVIRVVGWSGISVQEVFLDDELVAEITMNNLNEWQDITIPPGEHVLTTQGQLKVEAGDLYFALSPETVFQPFTPSIAFGDLTQTWSELTDVVISSNRINSVDDGWQEVTKKIPVHDLIKHWNYNINSINQVVFELIKQGSDAWFNLDRFEVYFE